MTTLKVSQFSCLNSVELDLRRVTVIIGPQASGKSLLAKLIYFFNEQILNISNHVERGEDFKSYLKSLSREFSRTFPSGTWGTKDFIIEYNSGRIQFKVSRKKSNRRISDEAVFSGSDFFENHYIKYREQYINLKSKSKDEDDMFSPAFDAEGWDLRRKMMRILISSQKSEYIESQLFIPAGRSFFTNLGKAVPIFEFGSQVDELTKRFGRLFTSLITSSGGGFYYASKPSARVKEFGVQLKKTTEQIFGGSIKLSVNDQHVLTKDGRTIPLTLLSSGQQELLPLLLALQHYTLRNAEDNDPSVDLLYIEEPEAHLFPSSQGAVIDHIVSIANFLDKKSRIFVTTHSPYVLSKLNNLIKASEVGKMKGMSDLVSKVIPRSNWITTDDVAAFALQDGLMSSIKDETGLINGSYLDNISDEISDDFMKLLEIEFSRG